MDGLEKLGFAIVLGLLSCVSATSNDDVKDQGTISDGSGPLWFGPRLGKRSLTLSREDDSQELFKLIEAANTLKYFHDQLPYLENPAEPEIKVTRKVIFSPKLGRHISPYEEKIMENAELNSQFGRRLAGNVPAIPADQEIYSSDSEQIDGRTKYLSPRLGRIMSFTPRLGRKLGNEMLPERVRAIRSINKTRAT